MRNAKFPWVNTLKSEGPDGRMRVYHYHRLAKVRIHAHFGTPEFAEEYRLAAEGHKTKAGRRLLEQRRNTAPVETNVYFIQAADTGLIKIGRAGDVMRRLSVLQTGSPQPLKLLASVPDTSGGLLERALHRDFADDRLSGEWFKPSEGLLTRISELVAHPRAAGVEVMEISDV